MDSSATERVAATPTLPIPAQANPIGILGPKLVAWFDSTDPMTMFQDVAGLRPIVPGGTSAERTVRRQIAKNDPAVFRTQPDASQAPIWHPTGYNGGSTACLVYDERDRSSAGCSTTCINMTGMAGATSYCLIASMAGAAAADGCEVMAINDHALPDQSARRRGSAYLASVGASKGGFTYAAGRAGADAASDYSGQLMLNVPYRLYLNAGSSGTEFLLGQGDRAPRSQGTVAVEDKLTLAPDIIFGASRWGGGRHVYRYSEQHSIFCGAALAAAEIAAMDAFLVGAQGPSIYAVRLKPGVTTGRITAGSTVLTVASGIGISPGDTVIVEPTSGYGTEGPGGVWPAAVFADEGAILSAGSSTSGAYVRAADTGKVYKAKNDGSGYYPWDKNLYYSRYCIPLPLVAVVTGMSGSTLELGAAAQASVSEALVAVDNRPILAGLAGPDGATFELPAGTFYVSGPVTTQARTDWTIAGRGPDSTILRLPKGAANSHFRFFQCASPTLRSLALVGNHGYGGGCGLDYSRDGSGIDGYGFGVEMSYCSDGLVQHVVVRNSGYSAIHFTGAKVGGRGLTSALDGAVMAGLVDACTATEALSQQTYVGWKFASANGERVEWRNCVFDSDYLFCAFETFASTGDRFVGGSSRNGMMAVNSASNWYMDVTVKIEKDCRDRTVLLPLANQGIININSNISSTSSGLNSAGVGGTIALNKIEIRGWHDAGGSIMRAISINQPSVTVQGTYLATDRDDGRRRGLITAPSSKARIRNVGLEYGYAMGPQINVAANCDGVVISGVRILHVAVTGDEMLWPDPYQSSIRFEGRSALTARISDTVTGLDAIDIGARGATLVRNLSGKAYAEL